MRMMLLVAPALLLAGPALAQKGPNPYLGQARVFYQGLEYEKCLQRLTQATKWKKNTQQDRTEIELYAGLCNFNLAAVDEAEAHFRKALELNAEVKLPPYTSPKIEALFDKVRTDLYGAATTPPVAEAPPEAKPVEVAADVPRKTELAPQPTRRTDLEADLKNASDGKSYSAPIALGGLALVAAGVGAYMGVSAKQLEAEANGARFESDAIAFGQQARQNAMYANVGFGVAAAAATAAIVTWVLSGDD